MRLLWKYVQNSQKTQESDRDVITRFLTVNTISFGIVGFVLWCFVRLFMLDSWMWCVCFTGYGAVLFGYMGGILYLLLDKSE